MRARVRELPAAEYDRWEALVAAAPNGSIYASPAYLDVLCGAAGGRFRVLVVERDDRWLGGVALYERDGRVGVSVSNRLLLQYNGIIGARHESTYPSERTARDLLLQQALVEWFAGHGAVHLLLHHRAGLDDWRVFRDAGWQVRPSWSYVVPLGDLTAQFGRVERNLRRLVKRCEGEGYTYDEAPDFALFHALHLQVHARKGAPLYLPEKAFARWFERLHALGLARLGHARDAQGNVAATQLVLHSRHPVAHTASAAADAQRQRSGANAFLRWRGFEALAAAGYQGVDLTDASLNPVTHFKAQLGGDLNVNWVLTRPDAPRLRAWNLLRAGLNRVRGGQR